MARNPQGLEAKGKEVNDQLNERLVSLMDYIGSVAKDADAIAEVKRAQASTENH